MLGAWVRLHRRGPRLPRLAGLLRATRRPASARPRRKSSAARARGRSSRGKGVARDDPPLSREHASGSSASRSPSIAWRNRRDPEPAVARARRRCVALVVFQGAARHVDGDAAAEADRRRRALARRLRDARAARVARTLAHRRAFRAPTRGLRALGSAAAAALVLQISLGGWTSANYAALACPDFPTCQTQWWPAIAGLQGGVRALARDSASTTKAACSIIRRASPSTSRIGSGALLAALLTRAAWAATRARARHARRRRSRCSGAARLQLCLGVSIVWFGVPLSRRGRCTTASPRCSCWP